MGSASCSANGPVDYERQEDTGEFLIFVLNALVQHGSIGAYPDGTHINTLISCTFEKENLTDMICGETERGVVKEGTGCGARGHIQQSAVLDAAPEILMFQFQRAFADENYKLQRRGTRIEYDLTLDLSQFQKPRYRSSTALRYRLTTVIMHSGDGTEGHYVAYNVQPDGTVTCANDDKIAEGTINHLLGRDVPGRRMFKQAWLPFLLTYVRCHPSPKTGAPKAAVALTETEKAFIYEGLMNLSEQPSFWGQVCDMVVSIPEAPSFTEQTLSFDVIDRLPRITQQRLYNLVQRTHEHIENERIAKEESLKKDRAIVIGTLPKLATRNSFYKAVAHILNSEIDIKLDIDSNDPSLEGLVYDAIPELIIPQLLELIAAEEAVITVEESRKAEEEQRKADNAELKAALLAGTSNDEAIGIIVSGTDVIVDEHEGLQSVDFDALKPSIIQQLKELNEAAKARTQQEKAAAAHEARINTMINNIDELCSTNLGIKKNGIHPNIQPSLRETVRQRLGLPKSRAGELFERVGFNFTGIDVIAVASENQLDALEKTLQNYRKIYL
ncbi:hypothetical protein LTS18_012636 [Coniosporium uncinatum]|uniref:Uncharacterized protein n=1 Tax=Coniosporium uncinatum TaxID=93489 RepID=A0ACC3D9A9_9PEZI|nr:hypothetical protein LTS18_012636 [Coniosporium uncinatum]